VSAWEYGYLYQADQYFLILDGAGKHALRVGGFLAALNAAGAQGWIIYEESEVSYAISNTHWVGKMFEETGMPIPANCSYSKIFMRREL
jgi:hypothetical protein